MWNKLTGFISGNKEKAQSGNQGKDDGQGNNEGNNEGYKKQYDPMENCMGLGYEGPREHGIRLVKKVQADKKIAAVIVSFHSGHTHDPLFTSIQQKTEEGSQVIVYSCPSNSIFDIHDAFQSEPKDETITQMFNYIKKVDPDCVVFNWECSSGYSYQTFGETPIEAMDFARLMIDRGHMTMFSDFSLKALIAQWRQNTLGPNPFVKVGQFGGNFTLEFEPKLLMESPSAQLQIVGELAAVGHCDLKAKNGTIVYGVDKTKAETDVYKLEVLTVVTSLNQGNQCEVNGKKGQAGHVLLTYKSGGHLLVSMGHWADLTKVETTDKVLFEVAAREYGQEQAQQMQKEYANLSSEAEKKNYISKNAIQFVQSSAPCSNMPKKARSKK